MTPTLVATRTALPPERAAAPADWQSQIRGPCLKERVTTVFSALMLDLGKLGERLFECSSRSAHFSFSVLVHRLSSL